MHLYQLTMCIKAWPQPVNRLGAAGNIGLRKLVNPKVTADVIVVEGGLAIRVAPVSNSTEAHSGMQRSGDPPATLQGAPDCVQAEIVKSLTWLA
jgi:hypothetical protein